MFRLLALILTLAAAAPAAAQDRYIGYYYPEITSEEAFDREIRSSAGSNKAVRLDFLTSMTNAQLTSPESPRYVFFAKGRGAETLILVALDDDIFKTLFRARAVMAQMTSRLRDTPLFVSQDLQFVATFYDLLQILGFETLVISDGERWAHKVTFKRH